MDEVSLRNHSLQLSLTVSVRGYEFPNNHNKNDANWLLVGTSLAAGEQRFQSTSPSLEAEELANIAAWFDALACQRLPRWACMSFTEPNLESRFFRSTDAFVRIGVLLSHESRPPFEISEWSEEALCIFELNYTDLAKTADTFRRMAKQFPTKVISNSLVGESQHFLDRLSSRFPQS